MMELMPGDGTPSSPDRSIVSQLAFRSGRRGAVKSVKTKFKKVIHAVRKVVLLHDCEGQLIALLRHWSKVPLRRPNFLEEHTS